MKMTGMARRLWISVACGLALLCTAAHGGTVTLYVNNGTASSGSSIFGTPFTTTLSGGIRYYYLQGDLTLGSSDRLKGSGDYSCYIYVGNDVNIAAGGQVNFGANNRIAGPGGGDGGVGGGGGAAAPPLPAA